MTAALAAFAISALLVGGFAILCLHAAHDATGRAALAPAFILSLVLLAAAGAELLGRPKPYAIEWRKSPDAVMISWTYREGVAIWVWAQMPGDNEPRSYRLPWSDHGAQEFVRAVDEAGKDGTGRVLLDLDRPPGANMAYAEAQPPNPPKDAMEGVGR
jgi:hypothetical protein